MDRATNRGMKVGRRGKDLAVRIPAKLVRELNLKAGDDIEVTFRKGTIFIARTAVPDAASPTA